MPSIKVHKPGLCTTIQDIGRTPLKLYNPDSETPVYISSGDYIRYVSISEEEYNDILKKVESNEYKLNIRRVKRGELNA